MKNYLLAVLFVSSLILTFGCGGGGGTTTTTTTSTTTTTIMTLTSSAFTSGALIPLTYAYTSVGGSNTSIPLAWTNAPSNVQSFALAIVDQSSSPANYVHWFVIDMPSTTSSLVAGASGSSMPSGAKELLSGLGIAGYEGPWPLVGSTHTYGITLYALSTSAVTSLNTSTQYSFSQFYSAISSYILDSASMTGTYTR